MPGAELRRPGRWSVRVRVTAVASLVVLVVLAAAAFAVVRAQERTLLENQKEALGRAAADLLAATDEGEAGGVLAGFGDDDAAYLVLDDQGNVMAASANAGDGAAPRRTGAGRGSVTRQVESLPFDGARFLVRAEVVDGPGGRRTVVVAATLDDIEEATVALRNAFTVVVPVLTMALAALLWVVVGRSLRPVEAIRAEVEDIGGQGLDRRVPVPPGDDEVARLARTMNGMLERIEKAADRQRRFVADAAHELRTPLTRMRTELEVDLAHPAGADPVATEASVLAEVEGLQRLVVDLLDLARSDAAIATQPVALDRLVAEVVEAARPAPPRRSRRCSTRSRCTATHRPCGGSSETSSTTLSATDPTASSSPSRPRRVCRAGGHRRRPGHPAGRSRAGLRALHPSRRRRAPGTTAAPASAWPSPARSLRLTGAASLSTWSTSAVPAWWRASRSDPRDGRYVTSVLVSADGRQPTAARHPGRACAGRRTVATVLPAYLIARGLGPTEVERSSPRRSWDRRSSPSSSASEVATSTASASSRSLRC